MNFGATWYLHTYHKKTAPFVSPSSESGSRRRKRWACMLSWWSCLPSQPYKITSSRSKSIVALPWGKKGPEEFSGLRDQLPLEKSEVKYPPPTSGGTSKRGRGEMANQLFRGGKKRKSSVWHERQFRRNSLKEYARIRFTRGLESKRGLGYVFSLTILKTNVGVTIVLREGRRWHCIYFSFQWSEICISVPSLDLPLLQKKGGLEVVEILVICGREHWHL